MIDFIEHISQRLENNGYGRPKRETEHDLFVSIDNKPVWICYLAFEVTPEQIRRCFEFPGYVLFVVKESLIPDDIVSRQDTPMWLRVLHGLYMGRVYVWNDRYLFGLHFDYDTGDVSESGIIQPDDLLLVETPTWLRGWPGTYRLARFYDQQWWKDSSGPRGYHYQNTGEQQSSSRQSYEQARDAYQRAQAEREKAQRQQYDSSGYQYDPNDWPGGKPPKPPPFTQDKAKRDFMREFMTCGNLAAAKALYRKLAKEFHPDLNPGKDTTVEMQQVNVAYERAERLWK